MSRLALLGIPALALVAVAVVIALGHFSHPADAHVPHPGVDFAIGIDTNANGTDDCTTRAAGPATCPAMAVDAVFVVKYYLDALGGVGFYGVDTRTNYAGVVSQNNAVTTPGFWPDCAIPATFYVPGEYARFGCAQGLSATAASTYTGPIGTLGFTCHESGTVSLVFGVNDTSISDEIGDAHSPGEGTLETLNIVCAPPGTPVPTNTVAQANTSTPTGPPPPTATPCGSPGPACTSTPTRTATATRTATHTPPPTATRTATPPSLRGDANGDHQVTSQDAQITLQFEAHLRMSLPNMAGADSSRDGHIDSIDALFDLWIVAGMVS